MRVKFNELKASKEKRFSAYQYEYSVLLKACQQYQTSFRNATSSGWGSKDEISKWQIKITEQLEKLKDYAIKPL